MAVTTSTLPLVTVVIETITARENGDDTPLVDSLAGTLDGVARQRYPADHIEVLVVFDADVRADPAAVTRRWPFARVVMAPRVNYFAAKNAGAEGGRGEVVALLDSDCVPDDDWLERHVAALGAGVDVVAGRTRYSGESLAARTFSVPDFSNVLEARDGGATGFNANNAAFRREVLLAHPLDARVRRNGGCYLLFHTLRAHGARVVYEPRAVVSHGIDVAGLGFAAKHFARGFDGANVYRLDDAGVLRGTPLVRRFGPLALAPLAARRIALDWVRLARDRRQIGIPIVSLPYYAAVMVATRLIELAGGVTAFVRRDLPLQA